MENKAVEKTTYAKLKEEGFASMKSLPAQDHKEPNIMIATCTGEIYISKGLTEVFELAGHVPKLKKDEYSEQFQQLEMEQKLVLSEVEKLKAGPNDSIREYHNIAQLCTGQEAVLGNITREIFIVHAYQSGLDGNYHNLVEKQKEIIQSLEKIMNVF